MQTGEEVAEDRAAVRQMADNFKLLRQQAVADVNNAGQTQTERVEEAGTQAVEDTSTAKTQALSEVQAAGAVQVSAVQTAGSAQVSFIQMEGDTQTERVQAAAAEIAADRGAGQRKPIRHQEPAGRACCIGAGYHTECFGGRRGTERQCRKTV